MRDEIHTQAAAAPALRSKRLMKPMGSTRSRLQRGFTLIELTVVGAVVTVLTVLGARVAATQALESVGEATGVYLDTVRGGLDVYLEQNFNAIANGLPVAGYANPLTPTVAELRAGGRLLGAFPLFTPFNSTLQIQVIPTSCPGPDCRLDAVAHQVAPLLDSAGEPLYGVASEVRLATRGGLASDPWRQNRLAGPAGDYPNPLGVQGGVVGVSTALDTARFNQFVRRNDDRLTTLDEALTVNAGPLAVGGVALTVNGNQVTNGNSSITGTLNVAGATSFGGNTTFDANVVVRDLGGNNCVSIDRTGIVTIACAGTLNAQTGVFTDGGGNTTTIAPTGITASGTVNGAAGLGTASATLFDAANPDRITVAGTQSFIFGTSGQLVAFDGGDVVATNNISGQRVSLREAVSPGAACAPTSGALGSGSEIVSVVGGGIATCSGGRWVALSQVGSYLGACSTDGSFAVDSLTGEQLFCKSGVWNKAGPFLSSFVLVATYFGVHGSVIPKPTCPNAGPFVGQRLIFLIPGSDSTTDGVSNRIANDLGASWSVSITNGGGSPTPGNVIAHVHCWYPGT